MISPLLYPSYETHACMLDHHKTHLSEEFTADTKSCHHLDCSYATISLLFQLGFNFSNSQLTLKRNYLFCYQTCLARTNWRNHQSMLMETRKTLRCSSVTFCFLALLFQNFQKIGLNCIILISERVLIHIPKMHSASCVINFQHRCP